MVSEFCPIVVVVLTEATLLGYLSVVLTEATLLGYLCAFLDRTLDTYKVSLNGRSQHYTSIILCMLTQGYFESIHVLVCPGLNYGLVKY